MVGDNTESLQTGRHHYSAGSLPVVEAFKEVFSLRKKNRDGHWKDNHPNDSSAELLVSLLFEFKFWSLQYKVCWLVKSLLTI